VAGIRGVLEEQICFRIFGFCNRAKKNLPYQQSPDRLRNVLRFAATGSGT